jgi:hypothetical protein
MPATTAFSGAHNIQDAKSAKRERESKCFFLGILGILGVLAVKFPPLLGEELEMGFAIGCHAAAEGANGGGD